MIAPKLFYDILKRNRIDFFCGVPDSLLKDFCAYITDNSSINEHIIAANEGGAIGLATGYNLATGRYPLVYMQNSGIGNSINPILSLADAEVYSVPMVLLIGWRGEPGVKDEPQHIKQGKVTLSLLDSMGIKYSVLSDDPEIISEQVSGCVDHLTNNSSPFAFIVKKNTFDSYKLRNKYEDLSDLTREAAISFVADSLNKNDIIVSTTGMISRELYEYRDKMNQMHNHDFLTVGSMGHANQIALEIALQKKDRHIVCFDGDGAIIMHMGSLCMIGNKAPANFTHILFNNGAHDSVGGQPTVALSIDLPKIALACGYRKAFSVDSRDSFESIYKECSGDGPFFIEIKVRKGSRPDLGRPKTTPHQNKNEFIKFIM